MIDKWVQDQIIFRSSWWWTRNKNFYILKKVKLSTFSKSKKKMLLKRTIFKVDEELSFDTLKEVELERRELLRAVKSFNTFNIMFRHLSGTVLKQIFLYSIYSWLNILLFGILRYIVRSSPSTLPPLNTTVVSILGAFISFFVIFYTNQMFSRYGTIRS